MDAKKLLGCIQYRNVRTPSDTDDNWDKRLRSEYRLHNGTLLATAARYETNDGDERVVAGGIVVTDHRDFCGGVKVSSGFVITDAHSYQGTGWRRLLGAVDSLTYKALPSLTAMHDGKKFNDDEARELVEKSLAVSVLAVAAGGFRAIISWVDKLEGSLSYIMRHLRDTTVYNIPLRPISCGMDVKPFVQGATIRPRFDLYHMDEVECTWTESPEVRNPNSGNTVKAYSLAIESARDPDEEAQGYCNYCDETRYITEYNECEDCGEEIDSGGRSVYERMPDGWRRVFDACKLPDFWRFIPTDQFKNG